MVVRETEFGMRLYNARLSRDMTQSELAEKVGCSKATVSYWETGRTFPTAFYLKQIANALQISLDELFDIDLTRRGDQIDT